jgi:hypothetical protein
MFSQLMIEHLDSVGSMYAERAACVMEFAAFNQRFRPTQRRPALKNGVCWSISCHPVPHTEPTRPAAGEVVWHADDVKNLRGNEVDEFVDVFRAGVEAGRGRQNDCAFPSKVGHLS